MYELVVGCDECAYRRGKRYGTILIHLEDGTPVDLLPDRQAASRAMWLKQHPGVQLISRDRAGEFARGARQGAPEARHPADRFHVLRNLAAVATDILGKSGRDMLDALVGGQEDPKVLATLARGRLRPKIPELQRTLEGRFKARHRFLIEQILSHIDFLDGAIGKRLSGGGALPRPVF